ncbi:MAG: methionine--tRNA ligase [SAR324 cluster bacterium]|uniref:Methionine--tRNA ligase n=1 Tax=SAR324 cluster bacterium TaxID=2024889 RepID=A0A2A4TAF0_9DELT|nr:MAG: methionine--tRNA ligase [SAR324 cluster bacterium]
MQKKKLITSALPYVNNVPHLGNIIGCVLSADVYARICRSLEYETLYICATDEYGTATENKAREEGLTPKQICDKYHKIHREVYDFFGITFDYFGRTSHPEHSKMTQEIYRDIEKAGFVEEKETEQTYCETDRMFLADRYVEGECPHCGYEEARGDQCDGCGKLLQPTELKKPKCKVCGNIPTRKLTKHLYLDLPKLEKKLADFQQDSIEKGKWSNNAISVAKSWLDNGLMARPITRDLSWGVKVPREGYENKVFYVWFDAPIGYISSTMRALPDTWKEWWQRPEETELYQFMAKDNIPFHTVVFPATMIGTGKPWTLLHHINSTEYLNYENTKFSKSRGVGVFGTDAMSSGIPADLWRFYLLFNRPEKSDSNFSWDKFLDDINNNFIDNIGNLLNRVLVFFQRYFDGVLTEVVFSDEQQAFLSAVKVQEKKITEQMESVKIREALKSILALGKQGNKFFQDEKPWATIKTDPKQAKASLTVLIYLVRDLALMLSPYMPETAERMLAMMTGEPVEFKKLGDWSTLQEGKLVQPEILYQKLQPKKIEEFKSRFNGIQSETPSSLESWQKVEIKVGEIKAIKPHPTADRLYVEEVDCGEAKNRTIVSGLVKYYQAEELLGKKVLVATNLTPVDLRGVVSEGMVLTAEKRKKVEVIDMQGAPVGALVTLTGEEKQETGELISIDQFFECQISVQDSQLQIEGKSLEVEGNAIRTQLVVNGKVK